MRSLAAATQGRIVNLASVKRSTASAKILCMTTVDTEFGNTRLNSALKIFPQHVAPSSNRQVAASLSALLNHWPG